MNKWLVLSTLCLTLLSACGGGGDQNNDSNKVTTPAPSSVISPTKIGLYTSSTRVIMPIQAIGTATFAQPLATIFDTGSAGVTLNALKIFPSTMVNSNGFIFPPGQTTLEYKGITITSLQATKSFGSGGTSPQTRHNGNLGFATLRMGGNGELVSQPMPILFYFNVTDANGNPRTPDNQGIFGVYSAANVIAVSGTATPANFSACTLQSTSSCHLVSPFRYINYGSGILAGFQLDLVRLNPACNVSTGTGCASAPILTVGLTPMAERGFSTNRLLCRQGTELVAVSGGSIPTCVLGILGTVTVATTVAQTFSELILFDTGSVGTSINVPPENSTGFPVPIPPGTALTLTFPSGFSYGYDVDNADALSNTRFNLNTRQRHVFGLNFFTQHAFFIDYSNATVGLQ